jgi:hypothetical protein
MYVTVPALLLAALLPTAPAGPEPRCHAELEGARLTTTIDFPDGYSVEGPWRVLQTQQASASEGPMLVVDMALDRIIEEDDITGERTTTPLQQPVTVTFEAPSHPQIVHEAAQTWCRTVLRARSASAATRGSTVPVPGRVT